MTTFIAFLRGVNLGKRRVGSTELRNIFTGCGFENVRTVIASGNVIFDSRQSGPDELSELIGRRLTDELGFSVIVFLRTAAQLRAILERSPFGDYPDGNTYVSFLSAIPEENGSLVIESRSSTSEIYRIRGSELYLHLFVMLSESEFFRKNDFDGVLGVVSTNRKLETVKKIVAAIGR